MKNAGLGRIGYLNEPIKIRDAVDKMKSHLKMKTFRLALANGKTLGKSLDYKLTCINVDLLIKNVAKIF